MLKITVEQLLQAHCSGAYGRFLQVRKTVAASYANRKTPAAFQNELRLYCEQRDKIVFRHGGEANPAGGYRFPSSEAEVEANSEVDVLVAQEITDFPGEPVALADLLEGGLLETDFVHLAPFLRDAK